MKASLIWDHKSNLFVPSEMGTPKEGQLKGTIKENLCELAGRVCYDSLGTGRDTESFHKHLVEVGHWSVYEHARLELGFRLNVAERSELLEFLVGTNGIEIVTDKKDNTLARNEIVVNVNLRHVLDWWKKITTLTIFQQSIYNEFRTLARIEAPRVFAHTEYWNHGHYSLTTFESNRCEYLTIFLRGSRGFSHEMVRHRYSMSQRSTRFCDESSSEWIMHPMLVNNLDEIVEQYEHEGKQMTIDARYRVKKTENFCKTTYDQLVAMLEPKIMSTGVDKLTARKQARGAARGYLGNALATELVFTAPPSGWHDMIRQRFNPAADWEIREIFAQVKGIVDAVVLK